MEILAPPGMEDMTQQLQSMFSNLGGGKAKKKRKVKIKDALSSRIRLEKLEVDDYYGFTIDGNHRFLLGDFTVTHNTTLGKYGLSKCLVDEDGQARPFAFLPKHNNNDEDESSSSHPNSNHNRSQTSGNIDRNSTVTYL